MEQKSTNVSDSPSLASIESNLFGLLFGFPHKLAMLMRQSELDAEGTTAANEKLKLLLDDATAEVERTKDFDMKHRLDAVYEEFQRFLKELAKPQGGDNPNDESKGD